MIRQVEERLNRKKVEVEIQIWLKLKELIKFNDLIKLLTYLFDLIIDLIEVKTKFESQLKKN